LEEDEMSQPSNEFETAWKQWRDLTVNTWSAVGQQLVETDSVVQAMGASFDWYLEMQRRMRESTQSCLQSLDVPSGEDLARLSRQVVAAEGRMLDCEDRQERVEERVDVFEQRVKRSEAAEDDVREQMAAMLARMDALEAALVAARAEQAPAVATPAVKSPEKSSTRTTTQRRKAK